MTIATCLIRITQIYKYKLNDVVLGAVFINPQSMNTQPAAHRVVLKTNQASLNIKPEVGQQWEVENKNSHILTQEITSFGGYVNVYRFSDPVLKCTMPDNGEGFIRFLSTEKAFRNIGRIAAQLLWVKFQTGLFDMLEAGENALTDGVRNFDLIKDIVIKEAAVKGLFEGYQKFKNLRYANKLVSYGIEAPIQQQLFRMADQDAINYLEINPYRLYSLGMSFAKADSVAKTHFNIKEDSDLRLNAIIEHALRWWSEQGNTVAHWSDIESKVSRLLKGDLKLTQRAKLQEGEIIGFTKKGDQYYITANYIFEQTVAARLIKLSKEIWHWNQSLEDAFSNSKPDGWELTFKQNKAVMAALTSSVFVLSGGAGTGKTTTLQIIVNSYLALDFKIHPVALSGKAARRLSQSIGIKSNTIAKLLHSKVESEEKAVLLIDEASMIDSYTMWRLVMKFSPTTRILLVGDPYQLPPINAGFVLSDIIKSEVIPHIELDEVKRQAHGSSIPAYANDVRCGITPSSLTTEEIVFTAPIDDVVDEVISASDNYSNAMIIAPTNSAVRAINIAAQKRLNASGKPLTLTGCLVERGSYDFKLGDPVVITLTNHKLEVQNGTLAKIVDVVPTDEYACILELEDKDENGEPRILKVDWELFEYLDLAYCLTLHKLQGSQAENVVVLLDDSRLIDRSWLYTALTRTENKLHIIASQKAFINAVRKPGAIEKRKTGLVEMLKMLPKF